MSSALTAPGVSVHVAIESSFFQDILLLAPNSCPNIPFLSVNLLASYQDQQSVDTNTKLGVRGGVMHENHIVTDVSFGFKDLQALPSEEQIGFF